MQKYLFLALILSGCGGSKLPSGMWASGPSRCEILPDHQTVLLTEVKDVEVQGYRYGQKYKETVAQSTLYLGQVDFTGKTGPVKISVCHPDVMGRPARELQLEWQPKGRQLKVDGQIWGEKSVQFEKDLYGWWKEKKASHWLLLSPGGSMVQVGTKIRRRGSINNYSGWRWLVADGCDYEALRGNLTLKSDRDRYDSEYTLKGDELTLMHDKYDRIQGPFHLQWDKDGHPQVPEPQ